MSKQNTITKLFHKGMHSHWLAYTLGIILVLSAMLLMLPFLYVWNILAAVFNTTKDFIREAEYAVKDVLASAKKSFLYHWKGKH